uniref:ATP synthase B chain n=2 Tax=Pterocladia TaxID=28859 RepID=A0A1D8X7Q3_9FLOR|nr:ATP synthase B chain precursor [Pterocladia mexicana]YP_009317652.1 ATP synthase B chain precursor [Pterocladia robusta]AOX49058.1 ATP synthase B chain precursor [Pterocladia mexicana]AOX49104.1 ATP synthase B chain precursor [Pterocladia robusta]
MLNTTLIILITLILISQNILLLNEETLILICFVTFIWLFYKKSSQNIKDDLNYQSLAIKGSIENSFENLISSLEMELKTQRDLTNLARNFIQLKQHFVNLNSITSLKLPIFSLNNYQDIYRKKLTFTQKLENQTSKLIALLLIKKLKKILYLKKFYTQSFQLSNSTCIQKISLREYFNFV